jgi:hypothetical protein
MNKISKGKGAQFWYCPIAFVFWVYLHPKVTGICSGCIPRSMQPILRTIFIKALSGTTPVAIVRGFLRKSISSFPTVSISIYWQPREFDPGHYQVTHENGALTLTNRFQAQPSHSRYIAKVEESKRLAFARNPFCQFEWADTLSYAGYSLSARPSFTSSEVSPFPIGFMELASTSSRRRSSGSHLFHVAANDIHGADRSIRPDSHGASGAL